MKKIILLLIVGISASVMAQNPLIVPDTLSGTDFDLTLQNGTFQFFDGELTETMGVNGDILGPTLMMNQGDLVNIEVTNNLDDTTTIHWHGMHVSAENDGGPHTYILSGETWNPQFTVMDKAGTYWYHPHLHQKTNEHVSKGIAGFIIVRDEEEAQLDLPGTYGVDDFPLVVQTKDFDENNQIVTPSNSDDIVMVNASIDASLDVPAQVVRLRVLNGTSQRVLNLGLSDNQSFYQIGSDGGLLANSIILTRLMLAPGERAELLVDFSGMEGASVYLMSYASELPNGIYGATNPGMMSMMTLNGYHPNPINGSNFNLLELHVLEQTINPVLTIPDDLVTVTPISESSADLTRNLTFTPAVFGPNQLNGHFLINGASFNMNVINYTIPLDNIEIWSIFNQSGIAHPFHIHDVQFFVLDRNGATPPLSEQGRKDVILVKPMETVRVISQFSDYANPDVPYMYHCHMLVHEDESMMGQFIVVDNTTGINNNLGDPNEVLLFPNPVRNHDLSVKIDSKIDSYEILNTHGEKIAGRNMGGKTNEILININHLPEGIYVMKINSGLKYYSKKFIRK